MCCHLRKLVPTSLVAVCLIVTGLVSGASFSGCERKERVVDIQTPVGDVEVNRSVDSGDVEVEVEDR